MIATAKALYDFMSCFGIPAYAVNTVPDDAQLPYLTYSLQEPTWDSKASFYVTIYYRNKSSNLQSLAKADEIAAAIGESGKILPCEGGYVVIWPESPLVQALPPDGDVRGAYMNLSINAYHKHGL